MNTLRYLEDLAAGQMFRSASLRVDEESIRRFAAAFDPQPFHLDDEAAPGAILSGLVASGWHTAALTMRLLVESEFHPAGGIVGAGVEELRWPRPVRPGDELRVEAEILDVRPSRTKPAQGIVRIKVVTLTQGDEAVQTYVANLVVMRRSS